MTVPGRVRGGSSSSPAASVTNRSSSRGAPLAGDRSGTNATPTSAGSAPSPYARPLGAGPTKQCQYDLTAIPTKPAGKDVLALQTRVETTLAGHMVTVLGQAASPRHTWPTCGTSPRSCFTSPVSLAPLSWRHG
jgi:hypothetical protein